jgi:ferritin-like metal-binding protein YciE
MNVAQYISLVYRAEQKLADAFERVAMQHSLEPDVLQLCKKFTTWCLDHVENIKKLTDRYGDEKDDEPEDIYDALFDKPRMGAMGLLRDLHGLWLLANEVKVCWTILNQAAQALRDEELEMSCLQFGEQTNRQIAWLLTKIKQSAAQVLVVAE